MYINSVLITDGCKGFGLDLVKEFLAEPNPPAHVFVTFQYDECIRELEQLQQIYPQLKIFQLNAPMENMYKDLAEFVASHVNGEGLNLLINNAEFYEYEYDQFKKMDSLTMDKMQYYFLMNATSPMLLIKEFYPLLHRAAEIKRPHISHITAAVVNMSSLLGTHSYFSRLPGVLSYKFSKAALNLITQCAANEFVTSGILVAGIHPGVRDFQRDEFATPEVIRELAIKCVKLIRGFEDICQPEGKLLTPTGAAFSLRPVNLRPML